MKYIYVVLLIMFSALKSNAQTVTVQGTATDSSKGFNVIEIVVNDTLSKVMAEPKEGRAKYLRMYQNPRYVVRTDSTGKFRIKALPTDWLYFKSYQHKTQKFLVQDLLKNSDIRVVLQRDNN